MIHPIWSNPINKLDLLPPTAVSRAVKNSPKWQKAMLDGFEYIGREQFYENAKFWDNYRMVDGKMSYMDLREAIPQLSQLAALLDDADIPTEIRHYPLIDGIIRDIVSKFIDSQDNFHITDTGEIAQNEYLRYYDEELMKMINERITKEIDMRLAERGINPKTDQEFSSPEEKQQYLQQMEQERQKATPEEASLYEKPKFKTAGMKWAENILKQDRERFRLKGFEKTELRDKLLSGRWFREYKVNIDTYRPIRWDSRNTFFSKEVDAQYPQDCSYVGRLHFMTPQEVNKKWHEHIPTNIKEQLLGGNKNWKNMTTYGDVTGNFSFENINDWATPKWVPFAGYHDYNFYLNLQDQFGLPMGEATSVDPLSGETTVSDRFLPRYHSQVSASGYDRFAKIIRDDFRHRTDLCQVTEVYFVAEDYWGILTYRTKTGMLTTIDVTEDLLKEFIKENKIKQVFTGKLYDAFDAGRDISEEDENTIRWFTRPVVYEGVKISSINLDKDLYLYCRPCEHQIKGDSDFDVKLPVAGWIGKPYADKVAVWQSLYNLVMNQMMNMLEKEIGMFFMFDIGFLPSEFADKGDTVDSIIEIRNLIRDTGFFPTASSIDTQRNNTFMNQFAAHNLTQTQSIQLRIQLAEWIKKQAYETLGSNPQLALQPTKYETAKGVQVSNKASYSQVSEIFEEFNDGLKQAWEVHLAVAQYCSSHNKEHNLSYTKSDGSMAFLKIADPNLPLRRLGLIPTQDSRKREEIENYRQWLFQTNTLGADPLDVAKLIFSDSSLEMIELAKQATIRKMQQQEQQHQREMQLQEQKAQLEDQNNQKDHIRQMERDAKNNETKVVVSSQNARGRALDNYDTPEAASNEITKAEKLGIEQAKIDSAQTIKQMEVDSKNEQSNRDFELRQQELQLKMREIAQKEQAKNIDKYIATINKN